MASSIETIIGYDRENVPRTPVAQKAMRGSFGRHFATRNQSKADHTLLEPKRYQALSGYLMHYFF